jgi:hypothetical protein
MERNTVTIIGKLEPGDRFTLLKGNKNEVWQKLEHADSKSKVVEAWVFNEGFKESAISFFSEKKSNNTPVKYLRNINDTEQ